MQDKFIKIKSKIQYNQFSENLISVSHQEEMHKMCFQRDYNVVGNSIMSQRFHGALAVGNNNGQQNWSNIHLKLEYD